MKAMNEATAAVSPFVPEREVVAVDGAAPIREAARIMAERKIGSVAVREGGKLVGLVSERDLVVRVLACDASANRPVREAMRSEIPRVTTDSSEAACVALMRDHATRHLLVEDGDVVVGVISMRDIIQRMLAEKQFVIEQLNTYIRGAEEPAPEPRLQRVG